MKKIILWTIVPLVVVAIANGAFCWLLKPQVITLPDGTQLTLLGVEYGRHHRYPLTKIKSRVWQNYGGPSSFDTTNDTLVVWIFQQHQANHWPNYQLLTYDRAETACVANEVGNIHPINPRDEVAGVPLDAYPRWGRKIVLRALAYGSNGLRVGQERFVISNPARCPSAKWAAEPLPDARSDGDLTVTLTKFVYGMAWRDLGPRSSKGPAGEAVLVAFHSEQNGVVATNWRPIRIETSDATGNHVMNRRWSNGRDANGDETMTYQWGLWPHETPWRLRVEMSQTSGFKNDERWTVQGVPVHPGRQQDLWNYGGRDDGTPSAVAETTLNGIHLKLFPVIQFTNQQPGNGEIAGGFRVQADRPLDGMQLTLVQATDEQGHPVPSGSGYGWGGDTRSIQLKNLRPTGVLNITLALHKSRFVEFTANPTQQWFASAQAARGFPNRRLADMGRSRRTDFWGRAQFTASRQP